MAVFGSGTEESAEWGAGGPPSPGAAGEPAEKTMAPARLREALRRPLITGASVSGDHKSASPGRKLVGRYQPAADLRVVARGGTPGAEVAKLLRPADFEGRSIILALDFFFWDSAFAGGGTAIAVMDRLLEAARSRAIPIVLGEVPELLPGHQPGREILNQAIWRAAAAYPRCAVMPFEKLFQQLLRDGYLLVDGERRGLFDLVPDGLHLADFASEYLADLLERELLRVV